VVLAVHGDSLPFFSGASGAARCSMQSAVLKEIDISVNPGAKPKGKRNM
jgi:hypothetical protein